MKNYMLLKEVKITLYSLNGEMLWHKNCFVVTRKELNNNNCVNIKKNILKNQKNL